MSPAHSIIAEKLTSPSSASSVHAQRSRNEVINTEGCGPLAQRGEALLPCGDLLLAHHAPRDEVLVDHRASTAVDQR